MSTSPANSSRLGLRIDQARWELGLPDGAQRLIAAGDFGGCTNETLVQWLASDYELARRLLRWCNSPLYNSADPYRTLEEASAVLDGRDLARLAVLAFVRGLFLPNLQIDIYQRDALWNHSIAVGAVAAMVSRTCGRGDPSMVFVAGALHDIGLYASERLDPESFGEVISQIDVLSPTHAVERDLQGWDHAQLGEAVLKQWGMPEEVQQVARHHHSPQEVIHGPHGESVACVTIANFLCSRIGWCSAGTHASPLPDNRVFAHLGIDSNLLAVLWQQLYPALDSVTDLR